MLNLKQANVDWMEPSPGGRWRARLRPNTGSPPPDRVFFGGGELGSQPDPTTGCTGCNVWLQLSSPQSRLQVFRCEQVADVPPPALRGCAGGGCQTSHGTVIAHHPPNAGCEATDMGVRLSA